MGYEVPGFRHSYPAGEDLTGHGYRGVKLNDKAEVVKVAAGDIGIGVLQNKPDEGEAGGVEHIGISFAEAGAAIPDPGPVQFDNTGRIIPLDAGAQCGTALESASKAGVVVALLLTTRQPAAGG